MDGITISLGRGEPNSGRLEDFKILGGDVNWHRIPMRLGENKFLATSFDGEARIDDSSSYSEVKVLDALLWRGESGLSAMEEEIGSVNIGSSFSIPI
jgi:hypothetical protein